MVRLSDTERKLNRGEAYYRCFGNDNLSSLLSRTQGLVIKNGYDLETRILEKVNTINDLDTYLTETNHEGIYVVPKPIIKKSTRVNFDGVEPDFMIFVENNMEKTCHVVELKDGCDFDTKSSEAEMNHIDEFIRNNAPNLEYTFTGHICCFNEETRENVVKGFKNKIPRVIAFTGREFCELLEIDYDEIVRERTADRNANLTHFITLLLQDEQILDEIKNRIQ